MLNPNTFYHIYNQSNGKVNLFCEPRNYEYFIQKFNFYLSEIVDLYAWCLMPNHFHFLVKIKSEEDIIKKIKSQKPNLKSLESNGLLNNEYNDYLSKFISQQFSNFFNSYTKSYHMLYHTRGNLFNHTFKRKEVTNDDYFLKLIIYIHNNPVHHKFSKDAKEWSNSSYHLYLDENNKYHELLKDHFKDNENFIRMHKNEDVSKFVL